MNITQFTFSNYKEYKSLFDQKFKDSPSFIGTIICTYVIECRGTRSVYVGSTENFRARWGHHLNRLVANNHKNILLQDAFNRFGASGFTITILAVYETTQGLLKNEETDADKFFPNNAFFNGRIGLRTNFEYPPRRYNRKNTLNPGIQKKARWFDGVRT